MSIEEPLALFEFVGFQDEDEDEDKDEDKNKTPHEESIAFLDSRKRDHLPRTLPELNAALADFMTVVYKLPRPVQSKAAWGSGKRNADMHTDMHTAALLRDTDFIDDTGMPLSTCETMLVATARLVAAHMPAEPPPQSKKMRTSAQKFVRIIEQLAAASRTRGTAVHYWVARALVSCPAITQCNLEHPPVGASVLWSLLYVVYVAANSSSLSSPTLSLSPTDGLNLHALMGACVRIVMRPGTTRRHFSDRKRALRMLARCIMPGMAASEILPVAAQVVTYMCINTAATSATHLCSFLRDLKHVFVFDDEPEFTPISIAEPMWLQFLYWASAWPEAVGAECVTVFLDMFASDSYYGIASWFAVDLLKKWRAAGVVAVHNITGTVTILHGARPDVAAGRMPQPTLHLVRRLQDIVHDQRGWLEL